MTDLEESDCSEIKIHIPEIILNTTELKKFFEFWFFKKSGPSLPISLLNKLSQLSLKPQTLLALILYFL